jgi:hypothetical protein
MISLLLLKRRFICTCTRPVLSLPPNEQIWFEFFYLLALLVARVATGANLLDSEVSRRLVFFLL